MRDTDAARCGASDRYELCIWLAMMIYMWKTQGKKKTGIGFCSNVELFDHFVALTKNASDHLNVTAFLKTHGKDMRDHSRGILAGMWIPRDYHWSIYALSAEGYVTVKSICVCQTALWSAVTEGSLPTSWVSRFSGCHNSSCNIWSLTAAVWNMDARLTCPL